MIECNHVHHSVEVRAKNPTAEDMQGVSDIANCVSGDGLNLLMRT